MIVRGKLHVLHPSNCECFFHGSLSGKLLGWQQSQDSQHIWRLYVVVSSCNRMAGRRWRQNSWVWQTWQGSACFVGNSLKIDVFFYLLQKDLFKGKWSLAEGFFKQNYCHACYTRFARPVFNTNQYSVTFLLWIFLYQERIKRTEKASPIYTLFHR